MSWCWLARTGGGSGRFPRRRLALLRRLPRRLSADGPAPAGERKIAARAVDPEGDPALTSLVLPPDGVTSRSTIRWSEALRAALEAPWPDVLSTLVVESSRFAGALTAVRDGDRARLASDPFRIFLAELVEVGPGRLGRTPAPTGPVIQRYGGGNPRPWDRF